MSNANTTKVKRPFEKEAQHNEEILNTFLANSTPEYQVLVNALLPCLNDCDTAKKVNCIAVLVGMGTTDNDYTPLLTAEIITPHIILTCQDNAPVIMIGVLDSMICHFNLNNICEIEITANTNNRYVIDFKENNISYGLDIEHSN